MKSVICFGEALIDFLNIGTSNEELIKHNEFRQYPGGAPANAAVAIAKLGGKSTFIGQVGLDHFGDFLQNSLDQYGVNTSYMCRHPSAKTALAFIMLDETGERSFSFYREQSADMLFQPSQIKKTWFTSASLFHFCSNTLTNELSTNTTQKALLEARENGLLISFDVNLRHNLWPHKEVDIDSVNYFVGQADLIKFSKEEIIYLAEGDIEGYIKKKLQRGVSLILVTDGPNDIQFFCESDSGSISPPKVTAIDTTAGGDSFIGAFLYALSSLEFPFEAIKQSEEIIKLIKYSSHCGAHAVTRQGAFPALPEFKDVHTHWPYKLDK